MLREAGVRVRGRAKWIISQLDRLTEETLCLWCLSCRHKGLSVPVQTSSNNTHKDNETKTNKNTQNTHTYTQEESVRNVRRVGQRRGGERDWTCLTYYNSTKTRTNIKLITPSYVCPNIPSPDTLLTPPPAHKSACTDKIPVQFDVIIWLNERTIGATTTTVVCTRYCRPLNHWRS